MSLDTVSPEHGKIVEGDFSVVDRWCEPCLCQGNDSRLIGRHKEIEFGQLGIEEVAISQ